MSNKEKILALKSQGKSLFTDRINKILTFIKKDANTTN